MSLSLLILRGMGRFMAWTMHVSRAESLATAANVFIRQTEAPLVVEPYVKSMTRSELMTLMTGGMSTIAGGVLAAYVTFLGGRRPCRARRVCRSPALGLHHERARRHSHGQNLDSRNPGVASHGEVEIRGEKEEHNMIEAAARSQSWACEPSSAAHSPRGRWPPSPACSSGMRGGNGEKGVGERRKDQR